MPKRILVVDDEPDVIDLVSFSLRVRGFEVVIARNGLEALLRARRALPDLVVLDVMMEGMDGLSVCEILRAQPSTKDIPIIIVTAATGEIAKVNSFEAGATDYMTKPFSPGELVRKVGKLLGTATSRGEESACADDRWNPPA